MSKEKEQPRYTKPNKLTDVITLISALSSIKGGAFADEKGLLDAIRSAPKTTDKWFNISDEFPEFFRRNGKQDYIALLLRSYFEVDQSKDKESRPPLTVAEAQNLINTAITLHDKELARFQKNAYKAPIKTAIISGLFLFVIAMINSSVVVYTNHSNNKDIDSLKASTQRIELKLNKTK